MALKGDLDSLDLGQVFQMLAINHKDGVLGVFGEGRPKALRFSSEGVTLQFDPAYYETRILERLRRQGRLSAEQMRLVEANRRSSGRSTLDVLIEMDFIDQGEVDNEYRAFMEEDIYELFFQKGARFEFFEGRLLLEEAGGFVDDRYSFNPGSVVMEAARRMDEWEMIRQRIPDRGEVYVKTSREGDPSLLDLASSRTALALADGWRSIDQILGASGRSEFDMTKSIMTLVDSGMLAPLDPRQYAATGVSALAEGRCAEAANLFERAGQRGFGLPEVLGAAGRAREENADFAVAAARYREYAVALSQESRMAEAARALLDAAELIPTDLAARKELVRIGLQAPDVARAAGYDAQALGRALHKNFTDAGDFDGARELLGWMIEANPDDMELRRALITCVTASGDQKALIELYEQTADHLISRREPSKAIPYLQKILMIDRSRNDVKERIKDLYKADERRRHRRNGTVTLALCAGFLAVLGGLFAFYERSAAAVLETVDVDSMISRSEFDQAKEALDGFRERYPLSLSAFRSNELVAKVAAAKRGHEAKLELERQQLQRLRLEQAKRATEILDRARATASRGDLVGALSGLRETLAAAPEDWKNSAEVQSEIAGVEDYLEKAGKTFAEARAHEAKGELEAARELYGTILMRYAEAPLAKDVRIPVRLETTPPGAEIEADGRMLEERTPTVLHLLPRSRAEVSISRRGYEPVRIMLETGDELEDQAIVLKRRPSMSAALPARALAAPAFDGELTFVALAGGRLQTIRTKDGESIASYEVPDLGELFATPAVDRGTLYFGDSNGRCVALHTNGRTERWVTRVDGAVRTTPLVLEDVVLFGTANGSLQALDRKSGQTVRKLALGGRIVTAAQRVGGFYVIGVEQQQQGELVLLDEGASQVVRRIALGAAPIEVLALGESRVLVATDRGGLAAHDVAAEESMLWSLAGTGPSEARPIVDRGNVLFAPDRELLELDGISGVVVRSKSIAEPMGGAPACIAGEWLYYASAGRLVAARRGDFSEIWRFGDELRFAFVLGSGDALLTAEWSSSSEAQMRRFDCADEWRP
ncbi:MAG: PQQ-binding-like beta-propeller repeat protein [Planctomycetes bacterium]|nr:PQQ-binding-like beta-propeller repeat protein [Planctomycetota bacterium]